MVYEIKFDDFFDPSIAVERTVGETHDIKVLDFFVTSGDAIQKSAFLRHVLEERRVALVAAQQPTTGVDTRLTEVAHFVATLLAARGTAKFAEIEWVDHRLYVYMKNPRSKPPLAVDG